MRFSTLALWPLFLSFACSAQSTQTSRSPEPTGIITGRVFCGDTGLPARLAYVSLMPIQDPIKSKPDKGLSSSSRLSRPAISITTSAQTSLDGSYILTHVTPGSYYVIVRKEGYINPESIFSREQLNNPTDQMRTQIHEELSRVEVEQNSTSRIDIQLQRGAAVSGTITYDDGSPASNIDVAVLHKEENGQWEHTNYIAFPGTNDRGYFRMNSLLPGTYIVQAILNVGTDKTYVITNGDGRSQQATRKSSESSLSFYGDGTPYLDQATSFTLRSGEERIGQDMVIPLSKLHKVSGHVAAGSNGHFVSAASVEIISNTETEKKTLAHTDIDREDGFFHFEFVPEGDYTLRVINARDVTWESFTPQSGTSMLDLFSSPKEHVIETYGNTEIPLLLRGDVTDIIATIPEKKDQASGSK